MERSKADAKAQAQKLIADADREGCSLLQDKILAQSAKDCEKLKSDARARMDKAAQAIIGRVVER